MEKEIIHVPFDVGLLPVISLKAGNLTCVYENGNLRYIKAGALEVVRMIYVAVRDAHWNTAPYTIRDETLQVGADQFYITYTAHYKLDEIHYQSHVVIKGAGNRIEFRMHGEALSDFKRNRIGLCLLHPLDACAGEKVTIEQPDGNAYEAFFPEAISPRQPFLNIRKMHWKAAGQLDCSFFFKGDVFETEDQRNWTDSSYKTYSTPLSRPIPAVVKKGDTVVQQLVLNVTATENNQMVIEDKRRSEGRHLFPKIGYARCTGSALLSDASIGLLQQVPFDHYRVELHFNNVTWKTEWTNALTEAKRLKTKLELILFFTDTIQEELALLNDVIQSDAHFIVAIVPLWATTKRTTETLLEQVYGHLKKLHTGITVGYGTDGFFADLNRNRPQTNLYDFFSFSLTPQVHLTDTRTLIENLEAQQDTIKTIKTFSPDKAIHVSPVTFKIRFADHADEKQQYGFDDRQHTSFGAWWTLACLANVSEATRVTIYQAVGPCGILNTELDTESLPLFKILMQVKQFRPKWISRNVPDNSITLENEKGDLLIYRLDPK